MSEASPRLVCLGNFTIDDVVLPDGREIPGCIGGDAFYAALAARLTLARTELAAPVGTDLPAAVREAVAARFSTAALAPRPLPTLHNRVAYAADGSRAWTFYYDDAAFDVLSPLPADLPPAFRAADAFLVLAMALGAQEALLASFRAGTKALVALDPQEDYIAGNEARLRTLVANSDVFLPSAEEVRRLLGHEDWPAAARTFAALGPRVVVVKLGPEGTLVLDAARGAMFRLPAFPRPPVDTTGAGDAFCGAFTASLVEAPGDLVLAARRGAVAAAFAIAEHGVAGIMGTTPEAAAARLAAWDAAPEPVAGAPFAAA